VIGLLAGCVAIAAATLLELFFPGKAFYQYGWYNGLLAAAFVICAIRARQVVRDGRAPALAMLALVVGTGTLAIAAVANGLFAPDPQLVIGSPGASVRVNDLGGSLVFPLETADPIVRLDRGGRITAIPVTGNHLAGAFALAQVSRRVLAVDVADARGAHLTLTQPNGSAFLSPVLTMPTQQTVAGMTLPFDTFAVPAAHRMVKVVLFDERHAGMLKSIETGGRGAALFAVDDEDERAVPHGMGLALDGQTVALGGLRLKGLALEYPAISVAAVPAPAVVALGLVLLLGGAIWCRLRKL
jgi:hypothetical protein